jgi:predicted component of type VI protein secretion system
MNIEDYCRDALYEQLKGKLKDDNFDKVAKHLATEYNMTLTDLETYALNNMTAEEALNGILTQPDVCRALDEMLYDYKHKKKKKLLLKF